MSIQAALNDLERAVQSSLDSLSSACSDLQPKLILSSRKQQRKNAASSFASVSSLVSTRIGAAERKRSLHLNVPCVFDGCQSVFAQATELWVSGGEVNGEYFRSEYGAFAVPLKPSSTSSLDEAGRAQDLPCINVSMEEWLDVYRFHPDKFYLKDFHLLSLLPPSSPPLYTPPSFAKTDVLNPFLLEWDGGDYRFVYWGPEGSATGLHSDVANTFSWSYNVIGKKGECQHDHEATI